MPRRSRQVSAGLFLQPNQNFENLVLKTSENLKPKTPKT